MAAEETVFVDGKVDAVKRELFLLVDVAEIVRFFFILFPEEAVMELFADEVANADLFFI